MRRRTVIAGIFTASLATPARAGERPRISILHSGFPNRTPIHLLFAELRKVGYEDGRSAVIKLLGAEGDADQLALLVAELAAERPDVIIAVTSPAVRALKGAGVTTPVVFVFVSDPVGLGFVESLAHPGGNFTRVTYSDANLGGKRLQLLIDALLGTRRVAVLWSPLIPDVVALFENIRASALAQKIEIFPREVHGMEDLASAFDDANAAGAQAVIFMSTNLLFGYRKEVAALAIAHHLPSIHAFAPEVEDGGLMSFGADTGESYRRAAALTAAILRGARPANLPVEEPTRYTLAVNLKTAAALGIVLPPLILMQAEEVIE